MAETNANFDPLGDLLSKIRQHPAYPTLLAQIKEFAPDLPRFKKSDADAAERARALWIYSSGRLDLADAIVQFLTGAGEQK